MEIRQFHLDDIIKNLEGASPEQLKFYNQWAAVGLDMYFEDSKTDYTFNLDGDVKQITLHWDSNFVKDSMKERKNISEFGGLSLAMFVMAILLKYKYVQQSEIGEGVDYRFMPERPTGDNFLNACHYVEISGILEETGTNTMASRLKIKHDQINRGSCNEESSVIITVFNRPITQKEKHL